MADVYEFDTQSGIILTDSGVILEQVSDEYKNTFGQDLVVPDSLNPEGATTPQGLLIVSEALARIGVIENNAAIANQINPNVAGGVFLDAIMALSGIQRTPAQPSTVLCTLTGVVGTIIPAGSQAAVNTTGALFELVSQTTIPVGGTITGVLFQSVETGAIGADSGTLTNIISNVLGWESITNPNDATLGQETQSDIEARQLRINTLAIQGASVAEAIISGVSAIAGFNSMTFRENTEPTTEVIDGVSMVAHSIYACVSGGTDLDVAEALTSKKSAGAAYVNTDGAGQGVPVAQNVTVPFSGQIIEVKFDRPTVKPVLVDITVKVVGAVQTPVTATKEAIVAYANGELDGIPGLVVGQNVSAFEIAGAVTSQYPGLYVQEVLIAFSPTPPASSDELEVEIYEQASIASVDITVTVI